jgi:hypothetical protein
MDASHRHGPQRETALVSSAAIAPSNAAITSACVRQGSSFQLATGRIVCHSSRVACVLDRYPELAASAHDCTKRTEAARES